ncbi:hypothetical protein [Roseomonas elaeocarpi]|uniref:Uncharacterized protein n=1 Tax=Roseomonas elaeocarpi TaxID=907779 RepID=A0ABV6JQZ1_9PROT
MLGENMPHAGLLDGSWLAESVRLTLFPPQAVAPRPLWQSIVGTPPEEVTERPAQNLRQESGPYKEGQLIVAQNGQRIDLVYAKKGDEIPFDDSPSGGLANVGEARKALEGTLELFSKIKPLIMPIARIAIAPTLVKKYKHHAECVAAVKLMLPGLPLNAETDREFLLQINRRTAPKSFPGHINNICKWQISSFDLSGLPFPPQIGMSIQSLSFSFLRIELDVNSLTTNEALYIDNIDQSFAELKESTQSFMRGEII